MPGKRASSHVGSQNKFFPAFPFTSSKYLVLLEAMEDNGSKPRVRLSAPSILRKARRKISFPSSCKQAIPAAWVLGWSWGKDFTPQSCIDVLEWKTRSKYESHRGLSKLSSYLASHLSRKDRTSKMLLSCVSGARWPQAVVYVRMESGGSSLAKSEPEDLTTKPHSPALQPHGSTHSPGTNSICVSWTHASPHTL